MGEPINFACPAAAPPPQRSPIIFLACEADMACAINGLDYLRSKTQVDLDGLDLEAAKNGARGRPYTDATSNQIEVFYQLENLANAEVIGKALSTSAELHPRYPSLRVEELAVEIATVYLAVRIMPYITGNVHVMANPCYSFDKERIIETGRRYHSIFRHLDPEVNVNRVVMKVPATWEGLRACKALALEGVQTLATTVFSLEQCILAGEVGCVSVSPFIHDLKRLSTPSYKDDDPLIDLCVQANRYYKQHGISTRVKACSSGSIDEILQLAGVDAHTLELADINALAQEEHGPDLLQSRSLFEVPVTPAVHSKGEFPSYVNNEAQFRMDFAASRGGRSQLKLCRAIDIFCDYQVKVESFFRTKQL